eukprot:jgi/Tetstr1/436513/TSEL_025339.t1
MGRRQTLRIHFRCCRMLPYMDGFLFFASSRAQTYTVRDRFTSLLGKLGLSRHPDKGHWEPVQRLEHLGIEFDSRNVVAWAAVLVHINGRSIYKPVETVYMHVDSSGYVRGAVLKERTEAHGLCYNSDRESHITYKELKAVRFAVLTFLSEPRGRQVLLHEDNMGVVYVLANLTSRSYYLLMTELWMLWFILDTNDISIRSCAPHQDHDEHMD